MTRRERTLELEESDIEDVCLRPDLWDEEDCPVSNAGSIVDNSYACRTRIIELRGYCIYG